MTEPDQYFLGYRQAEQERLRRQAQELAHEARGLFARVGLAKGERVVEIGCGPQGCLDILSELVGPSGHVVGVERSEEAVGFARQLVADRNLDTVEVLHGDARATGLPRGAFDCATARLVLVNVPQPEQIVAEAAALVRPGGVVAFHEADWGAHICDPPLDAWTRLLELLDSYPARTKSTCSSAGECHGCYVRQASSTSKSNRSCTSIRQGMVAARSTWSSSRT